MPPAGVPGRACANTGQGRGAWPPHRLGPPVAPTVSTIYLWPTKWTRPNISWSQTMGPEVPEVDEAPPVVRARARRGVSLIFVSLLVIGLAGLDFVHPSTRAETSPVAVAASATYQLAAVDFVSPDTGWFAANFQSGPFPLMHTADAANPLA